MHNYGAHVATSELIAAIIRHGSHREYEVFCDPEWHGAWREFETAHRGRAPYAPNVQLRTADQLARKDMSEDVRGILASPGNMARLTALRTSLGWPEIPVIGVTHSLSYPESAEFFASLILEWPSPKDAVVVASEAAKRVAESLVEQASSRLAARGLPDPAYPGRLVRIPFGVDTDRFRPRDRQDCRAQLGLPAQRFTVLSLSRWSVHDKLDPLPLLVAFREFRRRADGLLVVAGEDRLNALQPRLRAAVSQLGLEGDVALVPNPSPALVPALYGAADCFTSMADNVQETFGLTVIEALASGLPCVVSDWSGYRELVTPEETGFLVPTCMHQGAIETEAAAVLDKWERTHRRLAQGTSFDCEGFVSALVALESDRDRRRGMSERAREVATETYAWPHVVRQYDELWAEEPDPEAGSFAPMGDGRDRRPLSLVDYAVTFAHYPTRLLDGSARVSITPLGSRVLDGNEAPLAHDETAREIDDDLLASLLERAASPLDVATLAGPGHGLRITAAGAAWHVAWMLKAGLLRVE